MSSPLPTLTPFLDPLRIPPIKRLRRDDDHEHEDRCRNLKITLQYRQARLHSQLPMAGFWTYDGSVPGPTIEVRRGQKVTVEWVNHLGGTLPVVAVTAPAETSTWIPQNEPGRSGGAVVPGTERIPPWTVAHLHGGRTAADSDGWPENVRHAGQSSFCHYDNDQRATLLWYHDHAMSVTRLNVFAGLAGAWIIRDAEEDALRLPSGQFEVPLIIQDRNLDVDASGQFTGQLLHKVQEDVMEFFGPYTLVNGTIWPYHNVQARQYRFRVLNGSNARTYRLLLVDENGRAVPAGVIKQIGTDGGLLAAPVDPPAKGLVLGSGERADLIVDFRNFKGGKLRLINTAEAPFGNDPNVSLAGPAERVPYPQVMEFRVSPGAVNDPFVLPQHLSSFQRLTHAQIPAAHHHRLAALVEQNGLLSVFELHEETADCPLPPGTPVIEITPPGQAQPSRYMAMPAGFRDRINWFVEYGATEVWKVINLTPDTHPFHIHLVQFQLIGRDVYDTGGPDHSKFDSATLSTASPINFANPGVIDANEVAWKDTVRVDPGQIISVAATFDGHAGRYVYHCHILEHEDHEMMRPFVVMPAELMMSMTECGGDGHQA